MVGFKNLQRKTMLAIMFSLCQLIIAQHTLTTNFPSNCVLDKAGMVGYHKTDATRSWRLACTFLHEE